MKILAFLQNQWYKEPEKIKEIFDRHPDKRNDLIGRFLFMGSLTGKRLQAVLGEELCDKIIWEEASPLLGGHSSVAFGYDLEHMKSSIETHKPDIILSFGRFSRQALNKINPNVTVVYAPHPTSRGNTVMQDLRKANEELQLFIKG